MSRRAQIIIAPFLLVPLMLLIIVGLIVLFRGTGGEPQTTTAPAVTTVPISSAATTTSAVISAGDPVKPVPTISAAAKAPLDIEDALLTSLYRDRSPAVVAIRILGTPSSNTLLLPPADPEATPEATPPGNQFGLTAEGSGFLIDGEGHIVTNNHVVEDAKKIEVLWTDGSTVEAKVIGTDPDSDLALLKVSRIPATAKPVPLGDSKQVQVGQRAIAIGNPFGLDSTMTVGIISARGRLYPTRSAGQGGVYSLGDVFQTDAAINPGNSGGPLFNSAGEVIGVNTAIRSESGANEGIGFAIPSNIVAKVAKALMTKGKYQHPYLGISMGQAITDEVAKQLKLPIQQGVPVADVTSGGPAAKAGVKPGTGKMTINGIDYPTGGDIVIKIDAQAVHSSADIIDYLASDADVGQTVTLTVLRDGAEKKLSVVLGARPESR